ncbi:MAG TPA: hypothetical protein VFU47_09980 [Armatimonadota bacterium]|nr:hypothetical protein [Armatimonadota bacterium]
MLAKNYDNRALGYLIGKRVVVLLAGETEGFTAALEAFDYPWVRLHHEDGRVACYPYQEIRLLALPEDAVGVSCR